MSAQPTLVTLRQPALSYGNAPLSQPPRPAQHKIPQPDPTQLNPTQPNLRLSIRPSLPAHVRLFYLYTPWPAARTHALIHAEEEQEVLRRRQARADHFKAAFFSILRAHESAVTVLLEEAAAAGTEAPDPGRLGQVRKAAVNRLTENYARRQETAA